MDDTSFTAAARDADPASDIQAHIIRASKFRPGKPRDWSFFFFFRILRQVEMDATAARLADGREGWQRLQMDLQSPSLLNAGAGSAPSDDGPAKAFRDWLAVLTQADKAGFLGAAEGLVPFRPPAAFVPEAFAARSLALVTTRLEAALATPNELWTRGNFDLGRSLGALVSLIASAPAAYRGVMTNLEAHLAAPAARSNPLPAMALYEVLRQAAPAFLSPDNSGGVGMVRSERDADGEQLAGDQYDKTPINVAFTHRGLKALQLDDITLRSFPEVFRQGMAARAQRLHDVGPSAPANWDGELGGTSVHGYFTGGFDAPRPSSEIFWRQLRADIRAFNDPSAERGQALRRWIGLIFRLLGMEILHIELGQAPYETSLDRIWPLDDRREHFGFRDGLSQPFVDLGLELGDAPPGDGTPSRRSTWTPAAAGEIFLDLEDEGGQKQLQPASRTLRRNATYLVFRKLEQNVEGFRTFLARQRPGDPGGQAALAAQFMGRWKNGAPLVRWPDAEREGGEEASLNDFRYAAEDPQGLRCPLGAHVRRANPRDTGGRNEVRHHRILRRGISYGGPLLPEGTGGDGEPRGMLFIAANARIDLQFEVIQGEWLNGGEFLGQAGLGRCPVTGAHTGKPGDTFLEAGGLAPVRGVQSFVTTRGGDYFFAPGMAALRALADPCKTFPPDQADIFDGGRGSGDVRTPSLVSPARLDTYRRRLLQGGAPIRLQHHLGAETMPPVAFVGRHADVTSVLGDRPDAGHANPDFSVCPYAAASRRMTRGETMLIGTDDTPPTADARARMAIALDEAWGRLAKLSPGGLESRVRAAAERPLQAGLRRTIGARRVDLVDDLAVQAAYGVLTDVFGVPGPGYLTEMAAALPFARQHVGELPRDWLAATAGEAPHDPSLTTLQIWCTVLVADLIGNVQSIIALQVLARQAATEMLNHLDLLILRAASSAETREPKTLLEAFVANAARPEILKPYGGDLAAYLKDVALILIEIVGSTLAVIPLTFASVMQKVLELRINLAEVLPRTGEAGAERLIYEAERLNPNMAIRMRRCERDTALGGGTVRRGDITAALIAAANLDPDAFPEPGRLSLNGITVQVGPAGADTWVFNGPPRDPKNYLLFGVKGSHKDCWGRNRVAIPVLSECLWAAARLAGLHRVTGPQGDPGKFAGVTVALPARFTQVQPRLSRRPHQTAAARAHADDEAQPAPCGPSAIEDPPA